LGVVIGVSGRDAPGRWREDCRAAPQSDLQARIVTAVETRQKVMAEDFQLTHLRYLFLQPVNGLLAELLSTSKVWEVEPDIYSPHCFSCNASQSLSV
jgi:hypothetical protein